MKVERFISDPAAALMAYNVEQDLQSHSHVTSYSLIIDVGGSKVRPATAVWFFSVAGEQQTHSTTHTPHTHHTHTHTLSLSSSSWSWDICIPKTSVTAIQSSAGLFEVLETQSTTDVCGDKYDDVTVSILANEFKRYFPPIVAR